MKSVASLIKNVFPYFRLSWKQLLLSRPPMFIGRYQMLKHVDQEPNADPKR